MLDFYYGFLLLIEACISTLVEIFIIRRAKSLKLNQILSLVMFTEPPQGSPVALALGGIAVFFRVER